VFSATDALTDALKRNATLRWSGTRQHRKTLCINKNYPACHVRIGDRLICQRQLESRVCFGVAMRRCTLRHRATNS